MKGTKVTEMSAANAIAAPTTTWNIDPVHSTAEFKVKHMMISNVKGQFSAISGVISLDEYDVTKSQVEASIEVGSINTHNPDRDAHLKSADFFDVQTFPILSFSSTRVSPKGEGKLDLRRKSYHSRSAPPGRVRARRAGCTGHRSVGQHADRHVSDHKDQPEGLRVDVEYGSGDRRIPGGR